MFAAANSKPPKLQVAAKVDTGLRRQSSSLSTRSIRSSFVASPTPVSTTTSQKNTSTSSRRPAVVSLARKSSTVKSGVASMLAQSSLIKSSTLTSKPKKSLQKTSSSSIVKSCLDTNNNGKALSESFKVKQTNSQRDADNDLLENKDKEKQVLISNDNEDEAQVLLLVAETRELRARLESSEAERMSAAREADDEVVELRRLAQELEDENRKLTAKLSRRDSDASSLAFELDETRLIVEELRCELTKVRHAAAAGSLQAPSASPLTGQAKDDDVAEQISELRLKLEIRDEQTLQLEQSLESRELQVAQLKQSCVELEKRAKLAEDRAQRQQSTIDDLNLQLKNAHARYELKRDEAQMLDTQCRKLRQDLRAADERLEALSLARKRDVELLNDKLSVATTRLATSATSSPTPLASTDQCLDVVSAAATAPVNDANITQLQQETRDLRATLATRDAQLDETRRALETMRRRLETRSLDVDCNNQELARRCQDLLEQLRQSEASVQQLVESTTDHSHQLVRATQDLREANATNRELRNELNAAHNELDHKKARIEKLDAKLAAAKEQISVLRNQQAKLNARVDELCAELDAREQLAAEVAQRDANLERIQHEVNVLRQDLRSARAANVDLSSERERLKADAAVKNKFVESRADLIEALRAEVVSLKKRLRDTQRSLELAREAHEKQTRDAEKAQNSLKQQLAKVEAELNTSKGILTNKQIKQHSNEEQEAATQRLATIERLTARVKQLEAQLSSESTRLNKNEDDDENNNNNEDDDDDDDSGVSNGTIAEQKQKETLKVKLVDDDEVKFLSSLVVDMQRECDELRNKLKQVKLTPPSTNYVSLQSNNNHSHYDSPMLRTTKHQLGISDLYASPIDEYDLVTEIGQKYHSQPKQSYLTANQRQTMTSNTKKAPNVTTTTTTTTTTTDNNAYMSAASCFDDLDEWLAF